MDIAGRGKVLAMNKIIIGDVQAIGPFHGFQ